MKKILLFSIFLFLTYTPVHGMQIDTMNVREAYSLYHNDRIPLPNERVDSLIELSSFLNYYKGVRDTIGFKYALDENTYKCINRSLDIWFDIVFDEYKYNRISGEESFTGHLIRAIQNVCHIKYFS